MPTGVALSAPLPFQQFQFEFAQHIRAPRVHPRPPGVSERRMGVYNELLYHNLTGFLDACFPVSRELLGQRRWTKLCRSFFAEWRSQTPYFREIPREFLHWLMERTPPVALPPYAVQLAHYEWVELAVDVMDVSLPEADRDGDLLQSLIVMNPALMNLSYEWPVHRIGRAYRPRKPSATQLIVYRKRNDRVGFIEVNAVSARLVAMLQQQSMTGHAALRAIAAELAHPDPDAVAAYGAVLLQRLLDEEVILGTI